MFARTHIIIAVIFALALESHLPHFDPTSYYVLVLFGALLPDIDCEKSTINKLIPITKYAELMFKHRGFFHSIFAPLLLYILIAGLSSTESAMAVILGYMSHLASDAFTKSGVNFLYPFTQFKISGPIKTGGWQESAIFYCGIMIVIFIFV